MHNRVVLALPPRDSLNIKVSFEFLKGICLEFGVVSAMIHIPSVVKERFIFWASFSLAPSAPVFAI